MGRNESMWRERERGYWGRGYIAFVSCWKGRDREKGGLQVSHCKMMEFTWSPCSTLLRVFFFCAKAINYY